MVNDERLYVVYYAHAILPSGKDVAYIAAHNVEEAIDKFHNVFQENIELKRIEELKIPGYNIKLERIVEK